jgi:hypothetical protein
MYVYLDGWVKRLIEFGIKCFTCDCCSLYTITSFIDDYCAHILGGNWIFSDI